MTHGDRRATESRDLSRFNIDNKYGRAALEATFKAIMGYEVPIVKPPQDYPGDFFKVNSDKPIAWDMRGKIAKMSTVTDWSYCERILRCVASTDGENLCKIFNTVL